MIGALAAMGFGPSDIRDWSMWEYQAVVAGWNRANNPEPDKVPAPDIETLREARRQEAERAKNGR